MAFFVALFVVLLLPVLWLVYVPVDIKIDTRSNRYAITQYGTMNVSFHPGDTRWISIKVFGFPIDTRSVKPAEEKRSVAGKTHKKRRRSKSPNAFTTLLRGLLRSVTCKRFVCSVDTEDVVLNAQLFPLMYFASHGPIRVAVNFEHSCYVDLWLRVRTHRLLWTLVKFFFTQ
jgi:hypothetical protein